jgi:hypothetical protein
MSSIAEVITKPQQFCVTRPANNLSIKKEFEMRWLWWVLGVVALFGLGFLAGTAVGGFSGTLGGMFVGGCAVVNEAVDKKMLKEDQLKDLIESTMRNKLQLDDNAIKSAAKIARDEKENSPCMRALRSLGG